MGWTRIDDEFPWHPKVRQAGPLAAALHVMALCHCNKYLTDGLVQSHVLGGLADLGRRQISAAAAKLVEAGLWVPEGGGYRIHDFLKYNPSREQALANRDQLSAARSESGRKGAAQRWQTGSNGHSNVMAKPPHKREWQTDGPVPNPVPVPNPSLSSESSLGDGAPDGAAPKRATAIPENFELTDEVVTWAYSDLQPSLAEPEVIREAEKWHDHHLAKGTTAKDWTASLRTWLRNASDMKGGRSPFGSRTRSVGHSRAGAA